MMIYNYSTHGVLLDSDPNLLPQFSYKYQTLEWHEKMERLVATDNNTLGIFLDFNLFLKNYFYNLFYNNPDSLFNFNNLGNLSIIPPIPFLGLIPAIGGFIYILKIDLKKTNIAILLLPPIITAFFVFLLGDINIHFFAIIIILHNSFFQRVYGLIYLLVFSFPSLSLQQFF